MQDSVLLRFCNVSFRNATPAQRNIRNAVLGSH
jgi:hypothetical protein